MDREQRCGEEYGAVSPIQELGEAVGRVHAEQTQFEPSILLQFRIDQIILIQSLMNVRKHTYGKI